jgi:N-formylglutamate amidohydrolase
MHHGLVWRTTADGEQALARKLTRAELDERLELVWRPYHRALAALIERKRARFGIAVVVAAHSMPSVERTGARDLSSDRTGSGLHDDARVPRTRADVVPGTRGRRSADSRLIDVVEEHAVGRGWTVRHDDPYAGGFTTQHYGRPEGACHAIQVELARRLYLDEATLRPSAGFAAVRQWCRELVGKLGQAAGQAAKVGEAASGGKAGKMARPA